MKYEKKLVETKVSDLKAELDCSNRLINDLKRQLETEQKMTDTYKLEIKARDMENAAKEKQLMRIPILE